MKKGLMILTVVCIMMGCQTRSRGFFIVEKVELNGLEKWTEKYKVTLKDDMGVFSFNHALYTDSFFTAGDTINFSGR